MRIGARRRRRPDRARSPAALPAARRIRGHGGRRRRRRARAVRRLQPGSRPARPDAAAGSTASRSSAASRRRRDRRYRGDHADRQGRRDRPHRRTRIRRRRLRLEAVLAARGRRPGPLRPAPRAKTEEPHGAPEPLVVRRDLDRPVGARGVDRRPRGAADAEGVRSPAPLRRQSARRLHAGCGCWTRSGTSPTTAIPRR